MVKSVSVNIVSSVGANAMALLILPATCDRAFLKMKSMKTKVRSIMSDIRSRELWVLVVERNFNISFENRMNDFANSHRKVKF
jgi:hypothetical protein